MSRPSPLPTTSPALVRHHFGLAQHELAALLGISRPALTNLEAGRRAFSPGVAAGL
jgi:transcriptional regulator with XRE-family HTH domain